ncbi:hypothetical protein KTD28_00975 [Burkholderia gladioli]|uniref:hypothetical protein n=1 Tax=Burkholderia gladioli TaxID=28095 RepID=UPI0016416C9B|nr:hypothetical protein [Burkholderia gladioli]MBU9153176.1 hypothetical protein [Burkholderia gladioli]
MDVHPLKSVSIADIESAIAKALTELTGQTFESSISTLTIKPPSSGDIFLGRHTGVASFELTAKPVYVDEQTDTTPFSNR